MKVLLLNGSPRKNGCTYTALNVVADALKAEGIDAEVFQAGDPDMENVKAAAAVASARRAGTTATLDVLTKYFSYHQMPVVSSCYWNMVHGNTPEEVMKDEEGVQIMRVLGKNMAWLLKCIEAGKKNGVAVPAAEDKIKTNFIR